MDQYELPYLGQLAFHNECDEGEDEDDIGKPSTYAERGRVLPSRHLILCDRSLNESDNCLSDDRCAVRHSKLDTATPVRCWTQP